MKESHQENNIPFERPNAKVIKEDARNEVSRLFSSTGGTQDPEYLSHVLEGGIEYLLSYFDSPEKLESANNAHATIVRGLLSKGYTREDIQKLVESMREDALKKAREIFGQDVIFGVNEIDQAERKDASTKEALMLERAKSLLVGSDQIRSREDLEEFIEKLTAIMDGSEVDTP